jgi:regulator of replication initiation timing
MKLIKINIVIFIFINFWLVSTVEILAETDNSEQQLENPLPLEAQEDIDILVNDNKKDHISEELEQAQKTIRQLLDEIEGLKKQINKIHTDNTQSKSKMVDIQDDMDELEDIVKAVELKSYLDRLNFNAELRTRLDWFDFKGHDSKSMFDPTIINYHEKVHMLGSNRLRLNLFTDISNNVKFYSRMGIFYNWNDQNFNKTPLHYLSGDRERTDSSVRVERAYVDYFIDAFELLPVAFSFGRLPTTDGLSTDFRDNTPRRSTFPAMSYDSLGDGIGFSVNLKNIIPLSNPALRFMYCRRNESNNDLIYRDHKYDLNSVYLYTAQFETGLEPFLKNSEIIFHYINVQVNALNLYDNNMILIPEGTHLFPGAVTSKDAYISLQPVGTLPDCVGNIYKFSLYYQGTNLFESGLDLFAGYAITRSNPSGDVTQFGTTLSNIDDNLVQLVGANVQIPLITAGLLDDTNKTPRNGQAFHCGLKYTLPVSQLQQPQIGAEFFKSSRYWSGFNFASEDPLNAVDVAGNSYNFYYIQPFNKWISLRIGHNTVNYDFKSGFYTFYNTPVPADWKITNTYCLMDAVF